MGKRGFQINSSFPRPVPIYPYVWSVGVESDKKSTENDF